MNTVKQKCNIAMNRLEDFIDIAAKGERVKLEVILRKQNITEKGPPEKPYYLKVSKDMYLLMGDFLFGDQPDTITVSKVYAMGCADEAITEDQVNKGVANERLKMDYARLKNAGIRFEEKFF